MLHTCLRVAMGEPLEVRQKEFDGGDTRRGRDRAVWGKERLWRSKVEVYSPHETCPAMVSAHRRTAVVIGALDPVQWGWLEALLGKPRRSRGMRRECGRWR